jgi:plastocyanin
MTRRMAFSWLVLAVGLAFHPGAGLAGEVVIADQALEPSEVRVEKGGTIAWVSQAKAPCTIVFDSDVARSMVCHSLVNFRVANKELRSNELRTGDRASFCELAPGRYQYQVRSAEGPGDAGLRGSIVVRAE